MASREGRPGDAAWNFAMHRLFRTKPVEHLLAGSARPEHRLRRTLGPVQLTGLGIGAIVGAGIFSTVGTAAAGGSQHIGAGPALIISFVLVALACGLTALCYAEFAAMVPLAGSAYTYAYATLGQVVAWVIGWDLILEYAVGNVAVAISWSDYFQSLLRGMQVHWPGWLGVDFRSALQASHQVAAVRATQADPATLDPTLLAHAQAFADAPRMAGVPIVFNLPAILIVALITWVLVRGIRESSRVNTVMVLVKLAVVALFVVVGAFFVRPENWRPFAPNGFAGISSAAAIIFFAYIGFDAISTAAEETREPQRNMPLAIMASLVICTVIYIAVALVLTGMLPWNQFQSTGDPLAKAFANRGLNWMAGLISLGAVFATTSVLLVFQLGQPRIFFAMARDGLLPGWAASVHPRYRTPHITTLLTGTAVGLFAAVSNINEVVELCNIGTLFAFVIVALGILVLRRVDPDRPRPFRTPFYPWVPLGAVGSCLWLMAELPWITWARFLVWLSIGLVFYFLYGYRKAGLAEGPPAPSQPRENL